MKFELVEFYEDTEETRGRKGRNCIGTVHIYIIDYQLDIRGIMVKKQGKGLFFLVPHYYSIDKDSGEKVGYPVIRFNNEKDHEEMMEFLHNEVKEEIMKKLKKC